jgi:uncharacterized protein YdeI (YjbR/CyaY-like superfamily)
MVLGGQGMAKIGKQQTMRSRCQWRAWLEKNHASEKELWVVFYKKHTGKASVTYDEAVEEALCFGWIDGIIKRIDDEKHMRRFSPRRRNSVWSELNKERARRMIAEGRMTEAGLAKVAEAKKNGRWDSAAAPRPEPQVPPELRKALAENARARRHFENLAPSYRKYFVYWIATAKREETRRKRTAEAVELLAQNKKLGMK